MIGSRFGRKDRLIRERRHDAYRERDKQAGPALCTECGALFVKGRWTWKEAPENAYKSTCPACRRLADNYPAGHIQISGAFYNEHRDEILNLIRNIEEQEKKDRPLERIMAINHRRRRTVVTTTGIHIARRIGEALARSYEGEFSFQYADGDKSVRVYWER